MYDAQLSMNIAEEPGWADVGPARFPSCELRKQGSTHSSGKGVRAASSGDCRPVKRARRCMQRHMLLVTELGIAVMSPYAACV